MIKIKAPQNANRASKCLGRGRGSGKGKTSGHGHKGQNARSGGGTRLGFEGGQLPLYRRIAVRGFSNYPFKKINVPINLGTLERYFNDGDTVDREILIQKKIIRKREGDVKILANGEISKKLTVTIGKVSQAAKSKIEDAGGKVEG